MTVATKKKLKIKIEIDFACPHCLRLNIRDARNCFEPDDIVECLYCKKRSIVTSVRSYLKTRQPE